MIKTMVLVDRWNKLLDDEASRIIRRLYRSSEVANLKYYVPYKLLDFKNSRLGATLGIYQQAMFAGRLNLRRPSHDLVQNDKSLLLWKHLINPEGQKRNSSGV